MSNKKFAANQKKPTDTPKTLIFHVFLRLLIFPAVASVIYLFIINLSTTPNHIRHAWNNAFFAAAAMTALFLMSEVIRFFAKKRLKPVFCNLGTILIILLFIVFVSSSF